MEQRSLPAPVLSTQSAPKAAAIRPRSPCIQTVQRSRRAISIPHYSWSWGALMTGRLPIGVWREAWPCNPLAHRSNGRSIKVQCTCGTSGGLKNRSSLQALHLQSSESVIKISTSLKDACISIAAYCSLWQWLRPFSFR